MSVYKIVFIALWFISTLFWLYYVIRDIIELKKDGDYLDYCLKLNIALCFMIVFSVIILVLN